ncbi:MAG: MFS transporter [Rickettsiaceae bacterium]
MLITKKEFLTVWICGLISGFTIMISSYTLNYWLSVEQINLKTIGVFSLVSLPYAINFTWAPIFDTIKVPYLTNILGSRLSWVLVMQLLLSLAIYIISTLKPVSELTLIACASFLISFFASAQDSILGAIRTELVNKNQQGEISGFYIFGYRIGMLLSSSGAVYASQFVDWKSIYQLFSIMVLIFPIILIYLLKDVLYTKIPVQPSVVHKELVVNNKLLGIFSFIATILKPVGSTKYIVFSIILLVLYRLPDNFISMMLTPFLHNIGYRAFEIATAGKLFGALAAMIGGLLASYIMKKKSLNQCLLLFGSIHAAAHMLYIVQELSGKNIYILFVITGFEGISGGMTMAAYIAFIASLCEGRFRATQYAFFSSMMGFSRSLFPSLSGYIVASFNWTIFFCFTTAATIPALFMIAYLSKIQGNRR